MFPTIAEKNKQIADVKGNIIHAGTSSLQLKVTISPSGHMR
jgi:hypothetical protein